MKALNSYESIKDIIDNNDIVLIYAKSNSCAVCNVLLPRVEEVVNKSSIPNRLVLIDDIPEFSGQFTVYAVPTVLIFVSGKEVFRQSQFLQVRDIEKELIKWKKA